MQESCGYPEVFSAGTGIVEAEPIVGCQHAFSNDGVAGAEVGDFSSDCGDFSGPFVAGDDGFLDSQLLIEMAV